VKSEVEDLRLACKDENNEEISSLPESMHGLSDDAAVSYHIGFISSMVELYLLKERCRLKVIDPAKDKSG